MDRGTWQATVHKVAKSQSHTHTCTYILRDVLWVWLFNNKPQEGIKSPNILHFFLIAHYKFFSCGFPKPWLFISSRIKSRSLGLISKILSSLTSASYFNSASHYNSSHPWRLMSPLVSKAFVVCTFHMTLSIAMSCFIVVYLVHMSGLSHTLLVGQPLKASTMSYLFVLILLKIMT